MNVWIIKYQVNGSEHHFTVTEQELPDGCTGDNIIMYVCKRFYETVEDFDDISLIRGFVTEAVAC